MTWHSEAARDLFLVLPKVVRRDGLYQIGHTGNVLGFTADMDWLEGSDAIVVALANVGSVDAGDVPLRKGGSRGFFRAAQQFLKEHGEPACNTGQQSRIARMTSRDARGDFGDRSAQDWGSQDFHVVAEPHEFAHGMADGFNR